MKESYWTYWIVLLGIFVIGVMMLVNSTTTGTTQDYYMLKEVTQASMVDAVDLSYYRLYGSVRMSKEKFVENFLRRFSENITLAKTYTVEFYDLYEVPPKVSVRVSSVSNSVNVGHDANNSFDIVNKIDAILEYGNATPGDNSSEQKQYVCPMDVTADFINSIINLGSNGGLSGYSYLNDWYKTCTANGSCSDKTAFKHAMNSQFPDLVNMNQETLMQKYPTIFSAQAFSNGWISVVNYRI